MFIGSATIKRHSVAKADLEMAQAPSGRRFRRLLGLARIGAHGLARRCRPDHGRPADWRGRAGLGIPEVHAARRRELVLLGDHAGSHAADVRNLGAAQPERIAGAGLLLFGRIGLAGGGRDRKRQRRSQQQQSNLKMSCYEKRHPSPSPKFGGIVGEGIRIRKHGWPTHHSTSVAAGRMVIQVRSSDNSAG